MTPQNKREEAFANRLKEYRRKLLETFGNGEFSAAEGARALGVSDLRTNMGRFYKRLIDKGIVYKGARRKGKYAHSVVYSCYPVESDPVVLMPTKKATKTRAKNDERAEALKAKFGNEPFTLKEAAEYLGLNFNTATGLVYSLRQRRLLRRGDQPKWEGGHKVLYAFLTAAQLKDGGDYDWDEPMEDVDPTNGEVPLELQLYGEDLKRYEDLRAKKFSSPYYRPEEQYGQIFYRRYKT